MPFKIIHQAPEKISFERVTIFNSPMALINVRANTSRGQIIYFILFIGTIGYAQPFSVM